MCLARCRSQHTLPALAALKDIYNVEDADLYYVLA
jgi:hypothetical protein